ncbi:MAG: cytochrome P450, partial [Acidimicrobiales bacterium]|nr:cytochrome P450 [Acidimicrobiales bacterium]
DEFPDPEVFDIGREKARNHISFGKGNHYCLGVRFAKFEARVVLDVLTQRLPQLQLAGGHDFETFPNISFRGPTRLDVAW